MSAILYEVKDRIAFITINRPGSLNAINSEVREGLTEAWTRARDDADALSVILTGAGDRAFSAGADLKEIDRDDYRERAGPEPIGPTAFPRPTQDLGLWKPIIAAIDGYCLGGGVVMAMDCDIRVASEKSVFGMPEVALGMVPGWWASVRAPFYMPIGKALEYFLTANNFDAWEAEKMGLVNYVLPSAEVMPKAEEIARKINENGPLAVRGIKECMYRALSSPLPEAARLEDTFSFITTHSEDVKEGVRAFWEKRKPRYHGR